MSAEPAEAPDERTMKRVNRRFVTGVTVVTAVVGGAPRGLAVTAFATVAWDPPTVLVCIQTSSSTHDGLYRAEHLAVNILSVEQMDVVQRFSAKSDDKFAGLDWRPGPFGSPYLERSSARMEVHIRERLIAGTHSVFVGRVVDAAVSDLAPMVYSGGAFFDVTGAPPLQ